MEKYEYAIITKSPQVLLAALFLPSPVVIIYRNPTLKTLKEKFIPDPTNYPILFNTLEAQLALELKDFCTLEKVKGPLTKNLEVFPLTRKQCIESYQNAELENHKQYYDFVQAKSELLEFTNNVEFNEASENPHFIPAFYSELSALPNPNAELFESLLYQVNDSELAKLFSCEQKEFQYVVPQYSHRDIYDAILMQNYKKKSIIVEECKIEGQTIAIGDDQLQFDKLVTINVNSFEQWPYYRIFVVNNQYVKIDLQNQLIITEEAKILFRSGTGRHLGKDFSSFEIFSKVKPEIAEIEQYLTESYVIEDEELIPQEASPASCYNETYCDDLVNSVNQILQQLGQSTCFESKEQLISAFEEIIE